ncbi:MAG: UV DNA damage repair endonuclease UvsE [Proteobacteria bacterium]|nr:UV DNA damage repair endonuclease UvsE [Pseudomonadota bacterium]
MLRLGLCCLFKEQDIKFRQVTASHLAKFPRQKQVEMLADICRHNSLSLKRALVFCRDSGIGCFRINSQILPVKTHPAAGYDIQELPGATSIVAQFMDCGRFCRENGLRTSFHPDQFIVLSSPNAAVVSRSVADLVYQAEVAQWVGADVINLHGGGVYGDKPSALKRLSREISRLPTGVRQRLTLENDDRSYSPQDLLPLCQAMDIPLVYDVHHHRCLEDGLTVSAATDKALATWNREPLFHLSSPINGWQKNHIRKHHDYIDVKDFPQEWVGLDITVEVEAKAKELAVMRLMKDLDKKK